MSTLTAKGLVLKETCVGEADKILTLLLKEHGRISVSARSARKTGSKFLSAAQTFCYADFSVYSGKGFYSLASAEPIKNFYGIAEDYDKLRTASYIVELADKTLMDGENCDEILYLLLVTLSKLEKNAQPPEIVRAVFLIKFLQLNGYSPETSVCSECGEKLNEPGGEIYLGESGTVCEGCAEGMAHIKISAGCLRAVSYILSQKTQSIFSFEINEKTGGELIIAAGFLSEAHMDVKLKSG